MSQIELVWPNAQCRYGNPVRESREQKCSLNWRKCLDAP
nr:MAG TPA: hypothetical protein [Caudoviricetes sp.]